MTTLREEFEALMPKPVKALIDCEDCNGTGDVGETERYMGEFQPPERERCASCSGTGWWIVQCNTADQVREAMKAVEERCAVLCDGIADGAAFVGDTRAEKSAESCAAAIRAQAGGDQT